MLKPNKNEKRNDEKQHSSFWLLMLIEILNICSLYQTLDLQHWILFSCLTYIAVMSFIVFIMSYIIPTPNITYHFFLSLAVVIPGFLWCFHYNNGLALHLFLIVTGLLSSRLEDTQTNKETIFISLITYAIFLSLVLSGLLKYSNYLFLFFLQAFCVIFVEMEMMFRVSQVTRYRKMVTGNSESSRSMMRLIERKKQEAELANRAKTLFLANMSHEIRTPINAVLGLDEMILRESNEEKILNYAGNIRNAGQMLLSLVNDILDFSKIESGKMEVIPTEYMLSSVLNDLVNIISQRAENKGLELKLDFSQELPSILYGDEVRIKQIIINLLTNAVKYTQTGSITFRIRENRIDKETTLLLVEITDTGIGIKPENINKLFKKFERIEESRNRNIEGTGLGINITQNLLKMMGSRLNVQSEYGKGSSFSFELTQKIIDNTPIGNFNQLYKKRKDWEPYRECFTAPLANVLVVDDNQMNLMVAKELLKNTKIQLTTVSSGKACLEIAHEKAFHIILMDHMMPDMDGIETLEKLREDKGKSQNAIVIALTANAVSGAREMYLQRGFADYLTKPLDGKKLEITLMKYLPAELITKTKIKSDENRQMTDYKFTKLNADIGLRYAGNEENYHFFLSSFLQESPQKEKQLNAALSKLQDGDYKNYTILVHSLKSTSAMLGAECLSETARSLEEAGKRKDAEYIKRSHLKMIQEFQNVREEIQMFLNMSTIDSDSNKDTKSDKNPDKDFRQQAIKLSEAISKFDFNEIESILCWMKENFPKEKTEIASILTKISLKIDELEYHDALEAVKQLLNLEF